jgi:nucleotide-binding universal stress UspA family protein
MKKILVTTDFSANSKAGIRFAVQMSEQENCELTFFHSCHIVQSATAEHKSFSSFEKSEILKFRNKLEQFVNSVYKSMNVAPGKIHYAISSSFITDSNIMKYADDHEFDFICISRSGSGKAKKLFGTNTSNLIMHSKVPVIAVPSTYRRKKISSVLYASDLANLNAEIKTVLAFSKPLGGRAELLHFNYPSDYQNNTNIIEEAIGKYSKEHITYRLENIDISMNLVANMKQVISKIKPSVLVMFTNQHQNFFEKLFLSSSTADYSMESSVPLLVFRK